MEDFQELKLDIKEIKADVKEISKTLDKNTASLIVHEARTTLAEKRIERFENGSKWMLGLIFSAACAALAKILFHS
jgi:hypothetical protein